MHDVNTEKGPVDAKVATNRAPPMDAVEDNTAQGRESISMQKRGARLQALANDKMAMVDAEGVVSFKFLKSRVDFGDKGGGPSKIRG